MSRTGSSAIATALSLIILSATTAMPVAPALAAEPQLNFKIYNPDSSAAQDPADNSEAQDETPSHFSVPIAPSLEAETPQLDDSKPVEQPKTESPAATSDAGQPAATDTAADTTGGADGKASDGKVLKGYVRVVPSGTKIPIIMDTAVDSDTSQEGDEFSARTSEDLTIDGSTVVPAGSIIKGRIAQLNAPRMLNRSGSVGLKFDTVTTPDDRQIPIVANLVARGGVVHARRGLKDIAFDTGAVALPTVAGLGIGALAGGSGSSNSSIGRGSGALIGAAVGVAVGVAILCSKKGKKVEVKPGDELKIELAEELRMPLM